MAISIQDDGRVTVLAPEGTYEVADLKRAVKEALASTESPRRLLFDLRGSASLPGRSGDEIRSMANFLRSLRESLGPRVAMVTADTLTYGLMRMGSAFADDDGFTAGVFPDMEGARAWLLET